MECVQTVGSSLSGMYLTFHLLTLRKYLTKNFELFGGMYPHFGPYCAVFPKSEYPSTTVERL